MNNARLRILTNPATLHFVPVLNTIDSLSLDYRIDETNWNPDRWW